MATFRMLALCAAGQGNDVLLLERYNWRSTAYLTGGHTGSVRLIAFSPNGEGVGLKRRLYKRGNWSV